MKFREQMQALNVFAAWLTATMLCVQACGLPAFGGLDFTRESSCQQSADIGRQGRSAQSVSKRCRCSSTQFDRNSAMCQSSSMANSGPPSRRCCCSSKSPQSLTIDDSESKSLNSNRVGPSTRACCAKVQSPEGAVDLLSDVGNRQAKVGTQIQGSNCCQKRPPTSGPAAELRETGRSSESVVQRSVGQVPMGRSSSQRGGSVVGTNATCSLCQAINQHRDHDKDPLWAVGTRGSGSRLTSGHRPACGPTVAAFLTDSCPCGTGCRCSGIPESLPRAPIHQDTSSGRGVDELLTATRLSYSFHVLVEHVAPLVRTAGLVTAKSSQQICILLSRFRN